MREFNQFLVEIIDSDLTIWGNVDDYEEMTVSEQLVVQALKRLSKRKIINKK